jgi:hypothetical protein
MLQPRTHEDYWRNHPTTDQAELAREDYEAATGASIEGTEEALEDANEEIERLYKRLDDAAKCIQKLDALLEDEPLSEATREAIQKAVVKWGEV